MDATPTLESLHAHWIAAFNRHDLDAHMALYTEDATLFGSVDALQVGKPAVRAYFAKVPATVRVEDYPMPQARLLAPDVAVTAGHVLFMDGDVPSPYRMTWVLVRQDGNWRITQHHGSPQRGA